MREAERVLGVPINIVCKSNHAYAPDDFLRVLHSPIHGTYRFTQPVNTVILGSCSHALGSGTSEMAEEFWKLLTRGRTGTVLLLSRCCGPYSKEFMTVVERKSPGITLLAPKTADYCDLPMSREVVRDLEVAGIICKVPAET